MSWLVALVTEAITESIIGVLTEWIRTTIVEAVVTFVTDVIIGLMAEWIAETVTALIAEQVLFIRKSLAFS